MDKYYHTTKYEYLDSISETGLVPVNGERNFSISNPRVAVYLSKEKIGAILMFFALKSTYETRTGLKGEKWLSETQAIIDYLDKKIEKSKNSRFRIIRKRVPKLEEMKSTQMVLKAQIENMKRYLSFKEYIGEGVYLTVSDVPDIKVEGNDTSNSWVERVVPPEDISVVLLKDKETGELTDNKLDVIHYFMANTDVRDLFLECTKTSIISEDKYSLNENLRKFTSYYDEHSDEFKELLDKFEMIEMPLKEYMALKNSDKSVGSI